MALKQSGYLCRAQKLSATQRPRVLTGSVAMGGSGDLATNQGPCLAWMEFGIFPNYHSSLESGADALRIFPVCKLTDVVCLLREI